MDLYEEAVALSEELLYGRIDYKTYHERLNELERLEHEINVEEFWKELNDDESD